MSYSIDDYDIQLKPLKGKRWVLLEDFTYQLSDGTFITIPKGFKTDLSSVPQLFWWASPPYGDFLIAALVHDYLYVEMDSRGRKFADKEMLIISQKFNNKNWFNRTDNKIRYVGVRVFGGLYWDDKNANA